MSTDSEIRLIPSGTRDHTKCRHFNGAINKRCEAGVEYASVNLHHDPVRYQNVRPNGKVEPTVYTASGSLPCSERFNHGGATCAKYEPYSAEEVAAKEAAHQRTYDLMKRGLSSCCEAPIDESRVIREGRHKGHGPRYCSKCGRCVFVV